MLSISTSEFFSIASENSLHADLSIVCVTMGLRCHVSAGA